MRKWPGAGTSGRRWTLLWAGALLGAACAGEPKVEIAIGESIPTFALESIDGTVVESASLSGNAVVLTFWATWCQPCLREIPDLKHLSESSDAVVVAIALDEQGGKVVRPFVADHDINYTVLLGNEKVFRRFDGFSIPYTLVLDRYQKIMGVYRGTTNWDQLEQDLKKVGTT